VEEFVAMGTGKIQFAPDYESELDRARAQDVASMERLRQAFKRADEHKRFIDAVVEAAKEWRKITTQQSPWPKITDVSAAEQVIANAVDVLIEFESSQATT